MISPRPTPDLFQAVNEKAARGLPYHGPNPYWEDTFAGAIWRLNAAVIGIRQVIVDEIRTATDEIQRRLTEPAPPKTGKLRP